MKKRIVILGGGESGAGAAVLAKKEGFEVFLSDNSAIPDRYKRVLDEYGIPWEESGHTEAQILNADEVIKSPGIPDKAPIITKLIEQSTPIQSEIEFAGRYTDAKMICITGSNGKTTTTMLTYHIFKEAGIDVGLAGNVGNSLAFQVAEDPHPVYIIELSSFQLDNMYDFRADIAILLNITPDHLDRYNYQMQNYVEAKFRILQNQTPEDAFIYWNDDPVIARELDKRTLVSKPYPFSTGTELYETVKKYIDANSALQGTHNIYNAMAATLAAQIYGIPEDSLSRSLKNFTGVEHRLEHVSVRKGVYYINDSKATNVNSCFYALESMTTPVILILGGTDKGNDYTEIENLVRDKVNGLVFLGVDNSKLHAFFDGKKDKIANAGSMEEAVRIAASFAKAGDTVLLSPCCASFDLFKNYEDRGRQFKKYVTQLPE